MLSLDSKLGGLGLGGRLQGPDLEDLGLSGLRVRGLGGPASLGRTNMFGMALGTVLLLMPWFTAESRGPGTAKSPIAFSVCWETCVKATQICPNFYQIPV